MGALDGITVVAIEQAVAAPYCTQRLADAGARVIKIERAGGETARHYDTAAKGTSSYFAWLNRGKESAVLDLKSDGDLNVLARMLAQADVLVQNLAPGALDRMGFGPERIAKQFPQLIAVSIVGYGQDTPFATAKAYDMLVQAETAVCAVTGTPAVPSKVGVPIADLSTGANAHAAVLEALLIRARTGTGQSIEVSMFDGLADWMAVPFIHQTQTGHSLARHGLAHAGIFPYGPFDCADGVVIIAVQTGDEWQRLCRHMIGRPDLADDPRYATNTQRIAARDELMHALRPAFAALPVGQAEALARTARIACARLRSVADLPDHPALRTVQSMLPDGQSVTIPRPASLSPNPGPVPALGEHTARIRKEFS